MTLAHSATKGSEGEPLEAHLRAVARAASERADAFGCAAAAAAAGWLHDIGKVSADFQAYITGCGASPDHSTAGAQVATKLYRDRVGATIAHVVAGHHAGLADGNDLQARLKKVVPDYDRWRDHASPPPPEAVAASRRQASHPSRPGFADAFLIRMLFSCLVDADRTETGRFYAAHETPPRELAEGGLIDVEHLAERLRAHLNAIAAKAEPTAVNALRDRVLTRALASAALPPGLFTLTVPTGGGKTLTSLAFALDHARRHGLRRVIYVIPYTSIIEQTAGVFRDALQCADDPEDVVLEHHSTFDWEARAPARSRAREAEGLQGSGGRASLQRATETWDARIVVTTAVQFFESLYAARTTPCRKLHNLARAVVVLDEAQTLPLPLLRPCLAAVDELARSYGSSVVLCTATQPAVRLQDGFEGGLDIPAERELAPDPPHLYAALRRVAVERRTEPATDVEIAARFAEAPQMLCIVNSRRHARELFAAIRPLPGARHLTTLMCPLHRREVLAEARAQLAAGEPVRLVATSLIEAGVDVSFPEVWRASAGLENILQAAGRCNRNDELAPDKGRVVVFDPAPTEDDPRVPPHTLRAFQQAADGVLRRHSDPLTLDAVHDYFRQLYWQKGDKALDDARLDGEPYPILPAIAEGQGSLLFPFASIARAFRMIDQAMDPVVVPWDETARAILARLKAGAPPARADLRRLQQYVVSIPRAVRADWLAQGAVATAHPTLGEGLLVLPDLALYDPAAGLRIDEPGYRSAESLVAG